MCRTQKENEKQIQILIENVIDKVKREKDTTSKAISCGWREGTEMDLTKMGFHLCKNVK
jgi:regulator of replication initiation timing